MAKLCPGSLGFLSPKIEVFSCPSCKFDVEIWSDEGTGNCMNCGKTMVRTGGQSCIDWCKFSKQCLGDEKYKQYGEMKALIRKEALTKAVEEHFGAEKKYFLRAKTVSAYAEQILAKQKGDGNLVIAAALLYSVGEMNAKAKYQTTDAVLIEREGTPVAQEILKKLDYPKEFILEVCDIISHIFHPKENESDNYKIVFDAIFIADHEKQIMKTRGKSLPSEIESGFLTDAGKEVAAALRSKS